MNEDIIVIFTQNGFMLDKEVTKDKRFYTNDKMLSDFADDPYGALLRFGFEDKPQQISQSLSYMHSISACFIEELSKNPDLEITRNARPLAAEERDVLLQKAPYAIGFEFITATWLEEIWNKLSGAIETELTEFDGSAAQYLLTLSS